MDYFHNPYWGANKDLQGFARLATIYRLRVYATVDGNKFKCLSYSHGYHFFHRLNVTLCYFIGLLIIAWNRTLLWRFRVCFFKVHQATLINSLPGAESTLFISVSKITRYLKKVCWCENSSKHWLGNFQLTFLHTIYTVEFNLSFKCPKTNTHEQNWDVHRWNITEVLLHTWKTLNQL